MTIETQDYIAAGYFLSRHVRDVDNCGITLRPVTLASDHSPREFFPGSWALSWCGETQGRRLEAATAFGIAEQDLDRVMAWADQSFEEIFGWLRTFFTLEDARAAARAFLAGARDLELWGVGLHRDLAPAYCQASAPPPPEPGYAPVGADGVHQAVCVRPAPLAPGGEFLGFELLVEIGGGFLSPESLHADEPAVLRATGAVPNGHGLIDSLDQALACCRHLEAQTVAGFTGWLPWRIVRYPLVAP